MNKRKLTPNTINLLIERNIHIIASIPPAIIVDISIIIKSFNGSNFDIDFEAYFAITDIIR